MPHKHPEDRVSTVISGAFLHRALRRVRREKLRAYRPGSVIILPGGTSHFHWAKSGEDVTQVTVICPLGLEYLDPHDDPREHAQS
jgi:quercetin dioxygenase-like cupin family protein